MRPSATTFLSAAAGFAALGDERRSVTESDLLMRFSELRYTTEMRVTSELLTGAAAT